LTTSAGPSIRGAAHSALYYQGIAAFTGLGAQLLQLALIARALPPQQFGLMGLASLFLWFGQALADLGLGTALVQAKQADRAMQIAAFRLTLLASILLGGLLYAASSLLEFSAPSGDGGSLTVADLMLWLSPCLPLHALTVVTQAGLQRELRFRDLGLIDTAATLAGLGGALAGLHVFHDARALALAQLAYAATRSVLSMLRSPWRFSVANEPSSMGGQVTDTAANTIRAIRPLYPFGAYQIAERTLNFFVGHLDKLILSRFLGEAALGLYTVAYQLAARPMGLLAPLAQRTAMPLFSRLQGETDRLRRAFRLSTALMAHAAAPVHLLGAALATPLLRLVLGPDWAGVVPIFQALCVWGFFTTAGQPAGSLLPAVGRADASLKLNIVAVATYALCTWMGSAMGPSGIAWGLVAGTVLVLVPYDAYLRWRATGIGIGDFLRAVLPALAISSVSCMVAMVLSRLLVDTGDFSKLETKQAALSLGIGLIGGLACEGLLQWLFAKRTWLEALRPQPR
jgi:O-antigen/teichoic acid export membrane protein